MSQSEKSLWHQLLETRISRRSAIKGGLAAAGASVLPMSLQVAEAAPTDAPATGRSSATSSQLRPSFTPIGPTTADDLVLPAGYRYNVVRVYGDMIGPNMPFGYNADYIGYYPMDGLEGGQSSTDGILTVNHEYTNPLLQYGYPGNGAAKLQEHIDIEKMSVGLSIFRVQRQRDGTWAFVQDSHNRRISAFTKCMLTGPVAGSPAVKGATEVTGSVGNCSGGLTPWGTVLSCEENVDEYGLAATAAFGSGWNDYVKEHQAWVLETDPYNPGDVPRKHTAMGRFRHENVAIRVSKTNRVVAYMGDDANDSCVYKFVSAGTYDPKNREANLRLLESGKLYAADFQSGKWVLVDYDSQAKLKDAKKADGTAQFAGQADVLFDAKASAILIGGTPVDRPEDIEIHPITGHVYVALTNNTRHGNFHGQIIRMVEAGNDPEAMAFDWDFLAVGGPQSGFSSPDNLVFDPYGNLWMVTDISSSRVNSGIYKFQGNNAMFFFNTEGPDAGKAIQFASGPVHCEMTGPTWTPDGTTMFLSLQHPGEESTALDKLTSHWPNLGGDPMPRPGVVAITGFPGWKK